MSKYKKHVIKKPVISTIKEFPIWRFDMIDRDGKFAFDLLRQDFNHQEVLRKLMEYGNMTWDEIGKQQHDKSRKTKHHFLKLESLSKDATDRIKEKHFGEDTDAIYSFAFQNLLRIIGIRRGAEFHIVWYDPKHEFCPSTNK